MGVGGGQNGEILFKGTEVPDMHVNERAKGQRATVLNNTI